MGKVAYVLKQKQTRYHGCHWPSCDRQVPPAMWGCKKHWLMLPNFRGRIWTAYRPGQEVDMAPSHEYLEAAEAAQDWIRGATT